MKGLQERLLARWPEFLLCLLASGLLELGFRQIGFLGLIPTVGPKNALPLLFGLLFGPAGAAGYSGGLLVVAMMQGELGLALYWEALCSFLVALGLWRLWYLPGLGCVPALKTLRVLLQYFLFVLLTGLGLGTLLALLPATRFGLSFSAALGEVLVSVLSWSLLLGMPIHIVMNSVFAIFPYVPEGFRRRNAALFQADLQMELTVESGVAGLMDAVEEFNETHQVDARQSYALLSCTEELAVAILDQLSPAETLILELRTGDSTILFLRYGGARYDPLAVKKVKGDPLANLDILGILMVREMAASAAYHRRNGRNVVKIVI